MASRSDDDRRFRGDPGLLAAASRLRYFTLREISRDAEAGVEKVRSFVRRGESEGLFEVMTPASPETRGGRPGPREKRWQVALAQREDLAKQVAHHVRSLMPAQEDERMSSIPHGGPSFLELLLDSVETLRNFEGQPAARHRQEANARRYLAAVRAEVASRQQMSPEDQADLVEAAQFLEADKLASPLPVRPARIDPSTARHLLDPAMRARLHAGITYWTDSLPVLQGNAGLDRRPTYESPLDGRRLEDALTHSDGYAAEDRPYVPAVCYLREWPAGTSADGFIQAIAARLAQPGPRLVDELPGLAVLAAVSDTSQLAVPLARALLGGAGRDLKPAVRRTCLLALGRLACCSGGDEQAAAAAYSVMTLGTDPEDQDATPALAAAALGAPMVDDEGVLRRLIRGAYHGDRYADHLHSWLDEPALMRNLALALANGRFRALKHNLSILAQSDYGRTLFLAFRRTQAVRWVIGDDRTMKVWVGGTVERALSPSTSLHATLSGLTREAYEEMVDWQATGVPDPASPLNAFPQQRGAFLEHRVRVKESAQVFQFPRAG